MWMRVSYRVCVGRPAPTDLFANLLFDFADVDMVERIDPMAVQ